MIKLIKKINYKMLITYGAPFVPKRIKIDKAAPMLL